MQFKEIKKMTLISKFTFEITDYFKREKRTIEVHSAKPCFTSEAWKDAKQAYLYNKPWYRKFFIRFQLIKFNTYTNEL